MPTTQWGASQERGVDDSDGEAAGRVGLCGTLVELDLQRGGGFRQQRSQSGWSPEGSFICLPPPGTRWEAVPPSFLLQLQELHRSQEMADLPLTARETETKQGDICWSS